MEKLIMVSDEEAISQYTHNLKFLKNMKQFHRFNDSYFSSSSSIYYEGDTITITMENILSDVKIRRKPEFETVRYNTKLSFIPSERNLVSVIKNIDQSYRSAESDVLFNYIFEWGEAKDSYTVEHPKRLSFTDNIEYINDGGNDLIRLIGEDKMIPAYYASSGVQSAMPLDVMADYFTNLVGKNASVSKHDLANTLARYLGKDKELTNEMLKSISNKMKYQSVQLFIEEPEQNLYPDSQRNLTINLVCALKKAMPKGREDGMLVMTTHSPYILSTLNVLIAEAYAMETMPKSDKLQNIVNKVCLFPSSAYSAYYIQEDGKFADIIDKDITMISGNELDGVSDWVDDRIARINEVLYGGD
ncbi:AAA family ATPase [Bacteroides finegoldii]